MSEHENDTFTLRVNERTEQDTIALYVTIGGRLGLVVDLAHGERAATFLTVDQWRALRVEGDRLAAMTEGAPDADV